MLAVSAGAISISSRGISAAPADGALARLETEVGGRIGVSALDIGSGARLRHRSGERFAMCSTFKWLLAAAVLARHQASVSDDGAMTPDSTSALVKDLVEASSNSAANTLLQQIGGPQSLTQYLRSLGDTVTRLDRNEPSVNTNLPSDPRDTTTPDAMIALMQKLLLGNALASDARATLIGWMVDCKTGLHRLRAGLPLAWKVGDKTGTGANGAVNDVAIAWPPARSPILIAAYLSESSASVERLEATHVRIGRLVAEVFSA